MGAPLLPVLALVLALPGPLRDEGDDQYHYIVGLAERGLHQRAVREADAFLESFPRHARRDSCRYRLATSLFELDRREEARQHFARLSRLSGFEFAPEVWFRLGQCELERGAFDAASQALQRARASDREYLRVPAEFLLGEADFRRERFGPAGEHYAAVLSAEDPAAAEYARDAGYGLCWCSFRLGQLDSAVERIEAFLERWPGDLLALELRLLLGEAHLESGRPEPALAEYRRVEEGPHRPAALRGAAFACARLARHAEAARLFGELLDLEPEGRFAAEAGLHRGIHLLQAGEDRQALQALRRSGLEPTAETMYWRAQAELRCGEPEAALQSLEAALERRPAEELAGRIHTARGDALFELGRGGEAASAYGRSGTAYALHAAAVARLNEGGAGEAEALARRLLEEHPQSPLRPAAWLALGEALLAQNRFSDSEGAFLEAAREGEDAGTRAEQSARRSRVLSRIGWCRFLAGDHAGAAEHFGVLTREHPRAEEADEALYMEGRSLEAAGEAKRARRAWQRYLERFPDGDHRAQVRLGLARTDATPGGAKHLEDLLEEDSRSDLRPQGLYELAERLAAVGDLEGAEKRYRELIQRHPDSERVPAARYGLAWCLFDSERFAEASGELAKVLARPEIPPELRLSSLELAIWSERSAGRPRAALTAFEDLVGLCREEERLYAAARQTALAFAEGGQGGVADSLFEQVRTALREPGCVARLEVERVWLALERGDADGAEARVRAAAASDAALPDAMEAAFFVGEARFEAGQDREAAGLYALAAGEASPVRAQALYKRGFALLRSNDPENAAAAFAALVACCEESPLFGESLFLLGEARYRLSDFEGAAAPLRRLRREVPEHEAMPKALFRLGLVEGRLERWRPAQDALAELARRFPDFENLAEAELWRGRSLRALGNRRAARQALERTIAADRGELAAQARLELGGVFLDEGQVDAALSEYLKVAVLYAHPPSVAQALWMAGQCLERQGDPKGARDRYAELLERHPGSGEAGAAARRLKELDSH